MRNSFHSYGDYRIEISGWGLDNSFFAERTELIWTAGDEKQVQLRRELPEGAMVFVRLLSSQPSWNTVPVAYRVRDVLPMDCNGRCQMRLTQLHPQAKESPAGRNASKGVEDSQSACNRIEAETNVALEEILP
jgi:hypothetical protein